MDDSEQCVIFEAIICVKLASLASARVRTPHLVLPGVWRGTRLVDSGGCLPHKFGSFESFEHQTFTRKLWGKQDIRKKDPQLICFSEMSWFVNKNLFEINKNHFLRTMPGSSRVGSNNKTSHLGQEHGAGIPRCTRLHSSGFWPTLQQGHEKILECTWSFFLYFFKTCFFEKFGECSWNSIEEVAFWSVKQSHADLWCVSGFFFFELLAKTTCKQTRRSSKLFCVCAESLVKRPV